jgi:nucleotidyltransferase substrate binding protein (TIGR01987 family)
MEQLKNKYHNLCKALETLHTAIQDLKTLTSQQEVISFPGRSKADIKKTYQDSMIQRFEYTYDLFWKYLTKYLETVIKIVPEIKSPKNIFRESFKQGLLSENDVRTALEMVDHRNLTTDLYNEEKITRISNAIPNYHTLIQKIVEKTREKS